MSNSLLRAEVILEQTEGTHPVVFVAPLIVKCLYHIIFHLKHAEERTNTLEARLKLLEAKVR